MARKIIILGGGISGLSTAWHLKKVHGSEVDVTILERTKRLGGWIQTHRQEGYLFELGPRSCRASGSGLSTLQLVEQLGLQSEILVPSSHAKKRYIYTKGALRKVPTNPLSFLISPLTRPLIWPLLREWRVPASRVEDESIHDFVERRLGAHAARVLIDPLISGIYAGDTRKLSVKSCLPFLHEWEIKQGSILGGLFKQSPAVYSSAFVKSIAKAGLFTFRRGMQQLVDTLGIRVDAEILTDCTVTKVEGQTVYTTRGVFEGDEIISAVPSHSLATILNDPALNEIPFTSVAVVCFGYSQSVLPLNGFGYLIPSSEAEKLLGVVWDSSAFPQHNQQKDETRLTCMIGGEHMKNFANNSVEDFIEIAKEGLRRHLSIYAEPDVTTVKLANHAIPQYTLGHAQRVSELQAKLSIKLTGSSYHGVSVNDCITTGKSG
ncbi:MAG: protoporphyrinogen oxidase [Chlamydiales bacterium]|nr:protoporphyrinogen oxidase [Chlamydiales bacterium]